MMTVTVKVMGPLINLVGASTFDMTLPEGATLWELLEVLFQQYGEALRQEVMNPQGTDLAPYYKLLVNGRNSKLMDYLDTKLAAGPLVQVMPPMAGGYCVSTVGSPVEYDRRTDLIQRDMKDDKGGYAMNHQGHVLAPLPGTIWEVVVKEGDRVKAGEAVIILEAMKMENEIMAPMDGVVSQIHVVKGDKVQNEQVLAVIE